MRRNVLINICGVVFPMLFGLVAIPFLLEQLGREKFGILTMAWVLIGYFGLLDLGLGRALTQYISRQVNSLNLTIYNVAIIRIMILLLLALGIL